ncbi:Detected protein of unknown function [Hibiscus syriacus]|uniref:Uncharacterized protein n=1 Tax=Hibiscus syriacus TaxID=106335 RepID=A0A6A3CAU3_HIBSY|nr:Detected protein of unknown function [Hibiscus syriacus]
MAKKKSTRKYKGPKQQNPSPKIQEPAKDSTFTESSMDDPNQKAQSLQSLNSLLVKQAYENRRQIEYLIQANEALGAELIKRMSSELQNGLLWVYMESQMKEMGGALDSRVNELCSLESERERLSLACKETDFARNDFELQPIEGSLMKEKILAMEGNKRKFGEEIRKLKVECYGFLLEIEELEKEEEILLSKALELEKRAIVMSLERLQEEKDSTSKPLEMATAKMIEACRTHNKKNEELLSEVSDIRVSFDQLTHEKDNCLKVLDEEKQNGVGLKLKVSEMEKILEEAKTELAHQKAEWHDLMKEKKDIESRCGSMAEDIDRLQNELLEAKRYGSFLEYKALAE